MNNLNIICPYCGKFLGEIQPDNKGGDIYCNACQKWIVYKIIKNENGESELEYK